MPTLPITEASSAITTPSATSTPVFGPLRPWLGDPSAGGGGGPQPGPMPTAAPGGGGGGAEGGP
ncbi:hypothetical protein ACFQGX_09905 [Nonomuraea dietziae]|uniref:hypothetical protein n=1 Tax=Nonomuraea dietziae TaxID=65515 RepID=UPI00360A1E2C